MFGVELIDGKMDFELIFALTWGGTSTDVPMNDCCLCILNGVVSGTDANSSVGSIAIGDGTSDSIGLASSIGVCI